jgi:hypothetical protein
MTTPDERTKAVIGARGFLEILARADEVNISHLVQSVATGLLRHYPRDLDLRVSASAAPNVWSYPERGQASNEDGPR